MGILFSKTATFHPMQNTHIPSDDSAGQGSLPPKPLVLIADGHEPSRDLLKTILRLKGCAVIEVELEHVIQAAEATQPSLIMVDLGRPFLYCLEKIKEMSQHQVLRYIPTIVTSGNASPAFRAEVLAVGYGELFVKPIDFDALEKLLDVHLVQPQPNLFCH